MPNKVFKIVVEELDFVGDILSQGITKKGVIQKGSNPDEVTVDEMKAALEDHIEPALHDFVSQKKAERWKKEVIEKLDRIGGVE